MLFRPSFCANCGERIERAEWGIFTSRRFCPVCESEFKGFDLIPRVIVGFGVLTAVFGFGSYLKSDPEPQRQPRRFIEQGAQPAPPAAANAVPQGGGTGAVNSPAAGPAKAQNAAQTLPPPKSKTETAEPTYFCGAETKKGTPCSRRVKGKTRCFQHVGMPAMPSADKIGIK